MLLIFNLILFISVFSYLLLCNSLFSYVYSLHPDDYFKFKITNWIYTITLAFVYMFLYILLLYCLRIYNIYINNVSDLKKLFNFFNEFFYTLPLEWYYILFIILFAIIFIIIFMLIIAKINKILSLEVYKLFFFSYIYKSLILYGKYHLIDKIEFKLSFIRKDDLITYFLREFMDFYYDIFDLRSKILKRRKTNPNYKHWSNYPIYKWSRNFILFSPLVPFTYDCIYNDFILSHFYYYLAFYIPLMIIKRIITNINYFPNEVAKHLWLIYYRHDNSFSNSRLKKNPIYLYLASPAQRKIFNIHFSLDFSRANAKPEALWELMALDDHLLWTFERFEQDDRNDNIYWNGIEYVMKVNNSYYTVLRDPNSDCESYPDWDDPSVTIPLGEEWYFIEDDIKKRLNMGKIERFILGYFNYKLDLIRDESYKKSNYSPRGPSANPNWWKVFSKNKT